MIERCKPTDFNTIYDIINDGASAYKGVIPADCWHEPYMPTEVLQKQMEEGVEFWSYAENGTITGVMGIQYKHDVTLIRHAYVRTSHRNKGIGRRLLAHLTAMTDKPILIGAWEAASWAIAFYEKNGFRLLSIADKNRLLYKYWIISPRQVETSVVLASADWFSKQAD
jgi:GNAT superfamily N-acetyltransferase